ncbi:alpha-L-fucosidase [Saccharopolyspora shandongensis]|uniref:alpha-L-fucosidase n=1 Tax=Saccharopolyspora shandongensis TaxID=418495 RepID=UPI0034417ED2
MPGTSARSARTAVIGLFAAVLLVGSAVPGNAGRVPASPGTNYAIDDPFTAERTQWWRDSRFGMFIHFGGYSQLEGEYRRPDGSTCQNAEWIQRECAIPREEYEDLVARFDPAGFDADAIARTAAEAGQRYLVITAKHHEGYAMWPTKVNRWNLRDHSAFDENRDILAELKRATDRYGIRLGFYYSIWDWHDPDASNPDTFGRYQERMREQLRELVSNYDPALLWFDGEWSTDNPPNPWTAQDGERLESFVRGLDPELIVNNRVGKRRVTDGDTGTPEQEIPGEPVAGQLWETCMTINGHWGYAKWDHDWKSSADLVRNLTTTTGRSGNYLLNVGPDARGRVPAESVTRLREMGEWLRSDGQGAAVLSAGAPGIVEQPGWGTVSRRDGKLYASVYDWPGSGGSLTLQAKSAFDVTAARVLGSDQRVDVERTGDAVTIRPSGGPANDLATVIELDVATPNPAPEGDGTGLTARFWAHRNSPGEPDVTRVDPGVNYDWKYTGSPDPAILPAGYSARWTGTLEPRFTETYTLRTVSSNAVRLWIDDRLVIDNWSEHGPAVDDAAIPLEAGRRYAIRMEMKKETNEGVAKLLWTGPNTPQQIIPARQLRPER